MFSLKGHSASHPLSAARETVNNCTLLSNTACDPCSACLPAVRRKTPFADSIRPVRKRRPPKTLDMEEPVEAGRVKVCTTPRVTLSRDPVLSAAPSAPMGTRCSRAAAAVASGCSQQEQQLLRQSSSLQAFDSLLHALGSLDMAAVGMQGGMRSAAWLPHMQLSRCVATREEGGVLLGIGH